MKVESMASLVYVFLALLGLLALSVGAALMPLGPLGVVANVTIAAVKAVLVMVFFMKLRTDSPLLRIVAVIGFAWVAVLIALSLTDVLTRTAVLV